MDNENPHAAFVAGDFTSERAVRGAPGGPHTQTTEAPPDEPHRPTESPAVAAQRSAPRSRVGLLRRWSVAELLVGAVSRRRPSAPPAEGSATRRRYQASVSVMRRPPAQLSATAAGGPG